MMPDLIEGLRGVARTRHDVAIYIANGHGVWEAALANVLSEGDKVSVALHWPFWVWLERNGRGPRDRSSGGRVRDAGTR